MTSSSITVVSATDVHRPSLRVLLAEDDDDLRELVAQELRLDGHEVIETSDGAEALASLNVLRHFPADMPDVVIMDVRMPRRSGLEVARAMTNVRWPIPVILVTGFGDRSLHEEAQSIGVVVFDKPFDMDDLRTALLNLDALPRRRSAEVASSVDCSLALPE